MKDHKKTCTLNIYDFHRTYKDALDDLVKTILVPLVSLAICTWLKENNQQDWPNEDLVSDCVTIYAWCLDRMSINSVYDIGLGIYKHINIF